MNKMMGVSDIYLLAAQDREFTKEVAVVDEGGWQIGDEASQIQIAVVAATYCGWVLGRLGVDGYKSKFYGGE